MEAEFVKIVVGLGNPGEEYKNNRHNAGFIVVDRMYNLECRMYNSDFKFVYEKKSESEVCKINNNLLLVKPQTFMNDSGRAVQKLLAFYKITNLKDLIVVHDDLDIELGKIKVQEGGQSAGHHGIESIMAETGQSDFIRVRVGIGRPNRAENQDCYYDITKNYLLSDWGEEEKKQVETVIEKAVGIIVSNL